MCGGLAEIEARGGFDAERLIRKADAVEILRQNFLFRNMPLDPQRKEHFAAFAPQRARKASPLLDKLLRDRGCAGHDAPGREILPDGAAEREHVHARMRKKPPVFHRHDRPPDVLRQLLERQPRRPASRRR